MTPKFKVGDKVRVLKPEEEDKMVFPFWMPEMDKMVGNLMTITEVVDVSQYYTADEPGIPDYPVYDVFETDMSFKENWIELAK